MIDVLISTRNDNTKQILDTLQNLDGLEKEINFNILLVNDSSKQLNLSKLSTNLKSRINLIKTPKRKGLAYALNYGASFGKSDYIARLDQGDLTDKKRFASQVEELNKNKKLAFVGLKSKLNYLGNKSIIKYSEVSPGPLSTKQLKNLLVKKNPLVHGSIMLRRSYFQELGGYDEDFLLAQDYELYLRFIKNSYDGKILDGFFHSHNFAKTSSTIMNNRKSRFYGIKARLKNFRVRDFFNIFSTAFILKDIFLLLIPNKLIQLSKRLKHA